LADRAGRFMAAPVLPAIGDMNVGRRSGGHGNPQMIPLSLPQSGPWMAIAKEPLLVLLQHAVHFKRSGGREAPNPPRQPAQLS
jgi:hypothetical protein